MSPSPAKRFHISLQSLVALTIVAGTLLVGSLFIWQGYLGMQRVGLAAATEYAQRLGQIVTHHTRQLIDPSQHLLRLLVRDPIATAPAWQDRFDRLAGLTETLAANPVLSAVYVGYANGDFLLIRPLDRLDLAQRFDAPDGAVYLVQRVIREQSPDLTPTAEGNTAVAATEIAAPSVTGEWRFYNDELTLLATREREQYHFDPRDRVWFDAGIQPTVTAPYRFFTTGETGFTLAQRNAATGAVVGMDISVADIAARLRELRFTPGTEIAVIEDDADVLAHADLASPGVMRQNVAALADAPESGLDLPTLAELKAPALLAAARRDLGAEPRAMRVAGAHWYGMNLPLSSLSGHSLNLLVAVPGAELFADARRQALQQWLWLAALLPLLGLIGLYVGHRVVQPLRRLTHQVGALSGFDFHQTVGVDSRVSEVHTLSQVVNRMADTIRNLQAVTATLNQADDLDALMQDVLHSLIRVVGVRSGAVYLQADDSSRLQLAAASGSADYPTALIESRHDLSGQMRRLEQRLGRKPKSFFAVNLYSRNHELLGLLVVEPPHESNTPESDQFSFQRFLEELSGAAAVAIETRLLIESQQRLLEAIIRLLANAIDAKSPYTGGHCERVPQLAQMLVEQAAAARDGPFADFSLTPAEREAFRIAAWLHDCGKITSPDYLVDKATKLETLYNRIHEVRLRFEVLWRDAELAWWRDRQAGGDEQALTRQLTTERARLREEFAFIAEANIGRESMRQADIGRLHRIGERRWWRHFDDRLGLSRAETAALANVKPRSLPAVEHLLADRPEHIGEWGERKPPVQRHDPANRWGFDMTLPEHAWHHGELYNLSIRRGTLNPEERFKVNEHIVQTIIMLESLPLPPALRRVPAIAGHHHEKLDGTGYPRRLAASDLSTPERVMVIADVFEALTAADRPYKPPKSLSESLVILADMARSDHIDPDLFELFLTTGVYRQYAEQFLTPEQRDPVDVDALLRRARRPGPAAELDPDVE